MPTPTVPALDPADPAADPTDPAGFDPSPDPVDDPRVGTYGRVPTGPGLGDSGILLGRDRSGAPVRLHLFRERVTAVTALLSPDLVAVLTVRLLAAAACVRVVTAEPGPWLRVRELGAVADPDLTVLAPLAQPEEEATFVRPLVVVRLGDQLPGVVRLRPGPWRAAMTVVSRFGPHAVAMAASSQLVMVGPQPRADAEATARALNLSDQVGDLLVGLSDGEVALLAGDRMVVVDLEPSPFEVAVRQTVQGSVVGVGLP